MKNEKDSKFINRVNKEISKNKFKLLLSILTHKKCSLRTLWALAHKKQRHFLGDQEPDTPCGFSPWFLTRYLILLFLVLSFSLFYEFLTNITLFFSAGLLKLFFNSVFINNATIIINSGVMIEIIPACIAGSAYILLLILNLTISMKIKQRILSILLSSLLLFALNVLRISFLSVLYYNNFLFFEFTHKLFWYLLSTIFVVGIWFFTAKIFAIKEIPVYSDIILIMKVIKNK